METGTKVILGVGVLVVIGAIVAPPEETATPTRTPQSVAEAPVPGKAPAKAQAARAKPDEPRAAGITMAGYTQIREGMTYPEVVAILGEEGEEISSSEIAGIRTVMYQWSVWHGANMNAMFQDGRLVQKAQFGLR